MARSLSTSASYPDNAIVAREISGSRDVVESGRAVARAEGNEVSLDRRRRAATLSPVRGTQAVGQTGRKDAYKHWQYWTPLLPTIAAPTILIISLSTHQLRSGRDAFIVLSCCNALLVVGFLLHAIIEFRYRAHALAAHFPHLCQLCGYDRRGSNGPCSECGTHSPRNASSWRELQLPEQPNRSTSRDVSHSPPTSIKSLADAQIVLHH
jgi:hypothetical protein